MQCPKPLVVKDEPFLRFLRDSPCVHCGHEPSDPHHLGNGEGRRRSRDDLAVSLCRECHDKAHKNAELEGEWELRAKQQRQRNRYIIERKQWCWYENEEV